MKVKLNGSQLANVKRGFTITERLDEELDTAVVIALNGVENEYTPFSIVEVFITNDDTADYVLLVDSDESTRVSKDLSIYLHTMSLVEATKLEERYMVDNIAFTQPTDGSTRYYLDDVLERVNAITPLEIESKHTSTRLFSLDSTMLSALSVTKSPQFYFSNQNFRQVVDEALRYVGSISRIRSFSSTKGVITKQDFNELKTALTTSLINKGRTNQSEYFANEMDIQVENGISDVVDVYPNDTMYASLTTADFIVTTNDMMLQLPKPIYQLSQLVMAGLIVQEQGSPIKKVLFDAETDITTYVYEEEQYQLLTVEEKKLALFYKKGDNKIQGFGTAYPQLWGLFPKSVLENIYGDVPFGSSLDPSFSGDNMIKGVFSFRVKYLSYRSQRVRVHRGVPTNSNRYQIPANQSAKALDISRLLNNAQGAINRLGNGDLIVETIVDTYANRIQVGQFTTDGYVVTTVEYQVNENYTLCKATLTKNFNRLSQFIGVDREFRQYNLPLNETVNRNLYYEEFVTVSTTPQSTSTPQWSSDAITWLRFMFDYSNHTVYENKTIKNVLAITKETDKTVIGNFMMGLSKGYHKNSNIFHFQFPTNKVAFYSPSDTIETPVIGVSATSLKPISYTDADGLMEYMDFHLVDDTAFASVIDLVPSFDNKTAATTWFNANYSSYPNGVIVYISTPSTETFVDLDGVTVITDSFHYLWYKRDGASNGIAGVYEENAYKMFYYYDFSSTMAVYNPSPLKPKDYQNMPSDYVLSGNAKMSLPDLVVKKDPSEVISMTYQLHFVPMQSNVFVGQKMMEHSPYIVKRSELEFGEDELYLWRSYETYRDGDMVCKGTRIETSYTSFTQSSYTDGLVLSASGLSGYNSWAIGNYNGDLYLAVNRTSSGLSSNVFIQFKNKL